jgi:hypothetical protein
MLSLHIVKDVVVVFREVFSRDPFIHPSVPSSIHGWHHIGKKTLIEINNPSPLLRMCCCLGKACPGLGGTPKILISISATNPTYIFHTMPEDIQKCWGIFVVSGLLPWSAMLVSHWSQPVQTSKFSAHVVCSCNFVLCTVKYTHTCALGTGFKLVVF